MLVVLMGFSETSLSVHVPVREQGDNHQDSHGFYGHMVDDEAMHNMVPLPMVSKSLSSSLCLLSENESDDSI